MSIVVNTPTSKIGHVLTDRLLAAGEAVTLISRSPEKVAGFAARGARVVQGSIEEPATLEAAFREARDVFWLTPPSYRPDFLDWQKRTAEGAVAAARAAGVQRVVVLSSIGVQNGPGAGPVSGLLPVENAFLGAFRDVTILRPGFFMENLLFDVQSLATQGAMYSAIPADKKMPFVATRDIGVVAAEVHLDRSWSGHRFRGIHGPADLTNREVAEILTTALGRPINFVEVTLEQARAAMLGAGMPDFVVDLYVEMYGAIREDRMDAAEPRSKETTTPTTLATFAVEVLKPAVEALR